DKLKPAIIEANTKAYNEKLTEEIFELAPEHFITSSSKHLGKEELLGYIGAINEAYFKAQK
ncbi:YihA family ribosome biogenesis GTP-binding protein, partial [Flavobacteriaceae bacterium]|nr:YihA family ribosome biogenesis GTP-binding protein [Flavobacteriaceae bacterium]